MCGFAGEVRRDGPADLALVERMCDVLEPRGPDGSGAWARGGIALAHRRLKIIDLSDHGAQPMTDERAGLTVVFNGCIYNHHELRGQLRALGADFRSTSDTEVLLHAYAQWGSDCVEHLKGMFAFAVVEHVSGRVVLARDRLGIKPLVIAEVDGAVRFASTLPALLAGGGVDTSVDPVALHHFFSWHAVVPPPHTILKGVRKLRPAHVLTLEPDGSRHERRYWEPVHERRDEHADWGEAEWADALLDSLRVAVDRRMTGDVPVGVLLSGGIDSSLIVALLAQAGQTGLSTFSIGFDSSGPQDGDEFRYSDMVAREFGTDHKRWTVTGAEIVEALPRAIGAMSEPMTSHDCVAFYLLSQEVSKTRKVVQSGQGADEVLGGYSWYPPLVRVGGDGLGASEYAAEFFDRPAPALHQLVRGAATDDVSRAFVDAHFARPHAVTPLDRALRLDTEVMLADDPVKRVDTMTMAWGLEARTPFLDHELVELAAACPPEHKLAHDGKGILKVAARGVVPDAVIDREKGYFPVPLLSHLEGPTLELVADTLRSQRARDRGLVDPDRVETLLMDPNKHRTNLDASELWQVASLELWLQEHIG